MLATGSDSTVDRLTPVTTFAGGNDWRQVSTNYDHAAAIKTDGTLWLWGTANGGQLGNGNFTFMSTPITTFAGGTNWKQVSIGRFHTTAIKTDGTLWTWGDGNNGSLGNSDTIITSTPVTTFVGGTNWRQVNTSGIDHIIALKSDGTLWSWGDSDDGELGINIELGHITPVTTSAGGTNWKQVNAGYYHTAAIKTDGTLWAWGANFDGRLGNGSLALSNILTPITTFAGGTNWKQVDAGGNYIVAIRSMEF
jgi:alpha-tubulin suppressor-like RCC1 family protein